VAGLALTVGLAVVLLVTALFAFVLDDVLEGGGIAAVDRPAVWWLAGHREAWLTAPLTVLSTVGGPLGAGVLAVVVAAVVAAARRSWLPLLLGLLGAGGLSLVVSTVKAAVGRPRPPLPVAAVSEHGFSFPSGHATGAAGVAGLSAWMLTRWVVRRWRARVAVWTAAILLVGGVGLSRVYLGVHYPSDVVGGWTVGTAWAAAVGVGGAWWERAARMRARIAGWVTAPGHARTNRRNGEPPPGLPRRRTRIDAAPGSTRARSVRARIDAGPVRAGPVAAARLSSVAPAAGGADRGAPHAGRAPWPGRPACPRPRPRRLRR